MKNILHISDLHFSKEEVTESCIRKNALGSLLDEIRQMAELPNIIVISGDFTWRGQKEGYNYAIVWINHLLEACQLSSDKLVVCAGNHDISLKQGAPFFHTTNAKQADKALYIDNIDPLKALFSQYCEFYDKLNIPKMNFVDDQENSVLVGVRTIDNINFIVLNSAWFYRDDETKNQMWIGLPHVEILDARKKIPSSMNYDSTDITIGVFHHPQSCLIESEVEIYSGRKATYKYFGERVHLLLHGHTHSENAYFPDRIAGGAYPIITGAVYNDGDYRNRCNMIRINEEDRCFQLDDITYDSSQGKWITSKKTNWETLRKSILLQPKTNVQEMPVKLSILIKNEMEKVGMEWNKFNEASLQDSGCIIWPVVPRPNLTVIHKAQAEIISLLHTYGCNIKILIANNGLEANAGDERFFEKLKYYMNKKGIQSEYISVGYLSDYYTSSNQRKETNIKFLTCFCQLCNEISLNRLISINEKDYSKKIKEEIKNKPLLRNIRPVLTAAAVLCEAIHLDNKRKHVVIAGKDEESLWTLIFRKFGDEKVGAIFNPVLKFTEGNAYQENENRVETEWHSKTDIIKALQIENVKNWAFTMFYYLPQIMGISTDDIFKSSYCGQKSGVYDELVDGIDHYKFLDYLFNKYVNIT